MTATSVLTANRTTPPALVEGVEELGGASATWDWADPAAYTRAIGQFAPAAGPVAGS